MQPVHSEMMARSCQLAVFPAKDGIAAIYYPLIMAKPILLVYFLPLLLFLSIALMNLVTAVLVETWIRDEMFISWFCLRSLLKYI